MSGKPEDGLRTGLLPSLLVMQMETLFFAELEVQFSRMRMLLLGDKMKVILNLTI